MNEIKEEVTKWRYIPYSYIGRLNIAKMSVILNLVYRFNAIPMKIPENYCVHIDKVILWLI